MAESLHVGLIAGDGLDDRQRLREVGFDPPSQRVDHRLALLPQLAECGVDGAGRGQAVAVGAAMEPGREGVPVLAQVVGCGHAQRVANQFDLAPVRVLLEPPRPLAGRHHRPYDLGQSAVELAQHVSDDVGRRLKRRLPVH